MTRATDLPAFLLPARKSKYGAKKQFHPEWGKFDSLGEMNHYAFLKVLQLSGDIRDLVRQITYSIEINGVKVCKVRPDYSYYKDDKLIVSDFKGIITPEAKLKFKLLKAVHGVEVLIIKKVGEKY